MHVKADCKTTLRKIFQVKVEDFNAMYRQCEPTLRINEVYAPSAVTISNVACCIHVFLMIPRVNSDYFPKQH
jgi:hypothetical protein